MPGFKPARVCPPSGRVTPTGSGGISVHRWSWRIGVTVSLAFAAGAWIPTPLWAVPVCRWIDDSGRTQYADVVPDSFKAAASCTDSLDDELAPEQRREAARHLAEQRARALAQADALARERERLPSAPAPAATPVPVRRPAERVTEHTSCATWWRLYEESSACFGPYRTTRGATRVEAFDVCNVVASPEPRCGPRSD